MTKYGQYSSSIAGVLSCWQYPLWYQQQWTHPVFKQSTRKQILFFTTDGSTSSLSLDLALYTEHCVVIYIESMQMSPWLNIQMVITARYLLNGLNSHSKWTHVPSFAPFEKYPKVSEVINKNSFNFHSKLHPFGLNNAICSGATGTNWSFRWSFVIVLLSTKLRSLLATVHFEMSSRNRQQIQSKLV